MYNFCKVTCDSGTVRFQHSDFHRDKLDRLEFIRRQNPSDGKFGDSGCDDKTKIALETKSLQAKIEETQMTIKAIECQNKALLEINRDQVTRFFLSKQDNDFRSFQLLFLLHSLMTNYIPDFVEFVREIICKIGWIKDSNPNTLPETPHKIVEGFSRILRDISFNKFEIDRLLRRLVLVLTESAKSTDGGPLSDVNRSRQVNLIANDFVSRQDTSWVSIYNHPHHKLNTQTTKYRMNSEELLDSEDNLDEKNESLVFYPKPEIFDNSSRTVDKEMLSASNNDSTSSGYHSNTHDFFSSLKAKIKHSHK
jgi:hypothetical protein